MSDQAHLTVALTVDHDAISDSVRRGDPPVKLSHAEFGPRVGSGRILELFAREGIPSTWFVPGHTLVTFPDDTAAIIAGGHEVACHGWYHEDFAELETTAQRDILARSFDAVRERTGAAPTGFAPPTGRSPPAHWSWSRRPGLPTTAHSCPATTDSRASATVTGTAPPTGRPGVARVD